MSVALRRESDEERRVVRGRVGGAARLTCALVVAHRSDHQGIAGLRVGDGADLGSSRSPAIDRLITFAP
jgi:hypothetical protein